LLANSLKVKAYTGPSTPILLLAVALTALTSARIIISYKCRGKYSTNRCSCFKNKQKCSVHCHHNAEHDYGYLTSLVLRTEKALLARVKGSLSNSNGDGDDTNKEQESKEQESEEQESEEQESEEQESKEQESKEGERRKRRGNPRGKRQRSNTKGDKVAR
jgi:hypothetical protein